MIHKMTPYKPILTPFYISYFLKLGPKKGVKWHIKGAKRGKKSGKKRSKNGQKTRKKHENKSLFFEKKVVFSWNHAKQRGTKYESGNRRVENRPKIGQNGHFGGGTK